MKKLRLSCRSQGFLRKGKKLRVQDFLGGVQTDLRNSRAFSSEGLDSSDCYESKSDVSARRSLVSVNTPSLLEAIIWNKAKNFVWISQIVVCRSCCESLGSCTSHSMVAPRVAPRVAY